MFEKLNEIKVLRDPIHEYIHIEYQIIWDCLNTPEFQRLRRIHQLGSTYLVYHTAEHSRFSHSLGVYEIVRRMVNEVEGLKDMLSEEEKVEVMLAGLLHDIGHGPFSHSFESILPYSHEDFTIRILTEDSEICDVLAKADPHLPANVASIITHTHTNPLLSMIVSGQLDADRMDYLLRDAYFTGVSYGNFDLERVLRTLRVQSDKLVIKESGIHTVEDYIMARYHMYWQVYYHPVSRSVETILVRFFHRLKVLAESDPSIKGQFPMFEVLFQSEMPSVAQHFALDEPACFYGFRLATHHSDAILSDLASRLLNRRLFDYADVENNAQSDLQKQRVEELGYDSEYYFAIDTADQRPYHPYQEYENSLIWILMHTGEIKELSQASLLVKAIVKGENKEDVKMFFPKEASL